MAARDPVADSFDETEKRLNAWGAACRRNSEALGLPTLSGIAAMIEHVRRQERLQKGVRKKRLRKKINQQRKDKLPTDAIEVAEVLGFKDIEPTAKGKQKAVMKPMSLQLSSDVALIDYHVGQLPNWMRATIQRSYQFGQPDRKACQDLRIPKDTYRLRRIAAVEHLTERLASIRKP